jgi:hypothetical protein
VNRTCPPGSNCDMRLFPVLDAHQHVWCAATGGNTHDALTALPKTMPSAPADANRVSAGQIVTAAPPVTAMRLSV